MRLHRLAALAIVAFFASAAAPASAGTATPTFFCLQNGPEPRTLGVYDSTGTCAPMDKLDPTTHQFSLFSTSFPYMQPGAGAERGSVVGYLDGLAYDLNGFVGAHPNASTDSSAAFDAAFAATKGGKRVRVPGGNAYTLSSTVTMRNGSVLQGVRKTPPGNLVGSRIILGADVDRLVTQSTIRTVTITIGSPAVFHLDNHGLTTNDQLVIETTGALPIGIRRQPTKYWVVNPTTHTFQISTKKNGAPVNARGSQSGVHTIVTYLSHSPSIVGMTFDGNKANHSALALLDLSPVELELHNSSFNDGSNNCVNLRTNPQWAAWLNSITNNTIFRCNGVGLYSEASDSVIFGNDFSANGIGVEHFSSSSRLIGNQIEVSTDTGLVVKNLFGAGFPATGLLVIGNQFALNKNADIHYKVGNGSSHAVYGPIVGNNFHSSGGIEIDSNVTNGVMVANTHSQTTSPNDIRFGGVNNTGWQIYGMVSEKTPANRFLNLPPDAQVISGGPGGAFNRLQSLILSSVPSGVRVADTRLNVFGSDAVLGANNVIARFGVDRDEPNIDAALLIGSTNGQAPYLDCVDGEQTSVSQCGFKFKHNTHLRFIDGHVQTLVTADMEKNAIVRQGANGDLALALRRQTDASPTGYLLRALDASGTGELFRIGVDGRVGVTGVASGNDAFATLGAFASGDLGLQLGRSGQTSGTVSIQGVKNGSGVNDLALQPDGGALRVGGAALFAAPVRLAAYKVATLPTCNAGAEGSLAYVTDANAPAWGATLAGGGAVKTLALCADGAWVAH
jgi:hypothetical protein